MAGPAAQEREHRFDRVGRALEHDLHRPVRRIARGPGDTAALRFPACRVAEEDSLHAAMSDRPAANHGHVGTVDT